MHIWGVKYHYPLPEGIWVGKGGLCARRGEGWRLPLKWVLGNQSTKHSVFESRSLEIKATCFVLWPSRSVNVDGRCNKLRYLSKDGFCQVLSQLWHDSSLKLHTNPHLKPTWHVSCPSPFGLGPTLSTNSVINGVLCKVWPGHDWVKEWYATSLLEFEPFCTVYAQPVYKEKHVM